MSFDSSELTGPIVQTSYHGHFNNNKSLRLDFVSIPFKACYFLCVSVTAPKPISPVPLPPASQQTQAREQPRSGSRGLPGLKVSAKWKRESQQRPGSRALERERERKREEERGCNINRMWGSKRRIKEVDTDNKRTRSSE